MINIIIPPDRLVSAESVSKGSRQFCITRQQTTSYQPAFVKPTSSQTDKHDGVNVTNIIKM